MNRSIDLLREAQGTVFVNEDGVEEPFVLLPPLSSQELDELQGRIPCPLPQDIRELLQFSSGFEGTALDIHFAGTPGGFGLEEIFPAAVDIAADGFGNFWVVDLVKDSQTWGPIFYACHDAPVIVFQAANLEHFIEEALKCGKTPWKSEINDVHEELSSRIWRENPYVLTHGQCLMSKDADLKAFAQSLAAGIQAAQTQVTETQTEDWEIIDLRNPRLGEGFSWGRYGARTVCRRFGEKRIFACQRKSRWRRFLDAL